MGKDTYSLLRKEITKVEKSKKKVPSKDEKSSSNSQRTERNDNKNNNKEKSNPEKNKDSGKSKESEPQEPIDPNQPDRSYGDYFCPICDSHMNSIGMWDAHVSGKRHIKNVLKGDPELKYDELEVESDIKKELVHVKDPIIGLTYIHEIRRREEGVPPYYNCFLCHASLATIPLVIDHAISVKHRLNYVKENAPEEYQLIDSVKLRKDHLDSVLKEVVLRLESKHGRGEVKVKQEKAKKYFPLPVKRFHIDEDSDSNYQKPFKSARTDDIQIHSWKSIENSKTSHSKREKDDKGYKSRRDPYSDDEDYYNRSSGRKLSESGYGDSLRKEDLRNKLSHRSYQDPWDRSPEPEKRGSSYYSNRSPSVEYLPESRHQSRDDLLPHEMIRKNTSNDLTSEEFLRYVNELPTAVFLKIFMYKADRIDVTGTEEMRLVAKVIEKCQELLDKNLPPEVIDLMKKKFSDSPSSSQPSSSTLMPTAARSNDFYTVPSKPPQPEKPDGMSSDVNFIKDFLRSVKNSNDNSTVPHQSTNSSQIASAQLYMNAFPNVQQNPSVNFSANVPPPRDTSRLVNYPSEAPRAGNYPPDTSRAGGNYPSDTSRAGGNYAPDTSRAGGNYAQDTSRAGGNYAQDTSRAGGNYAQDTSRAGGNYPQDTSRAGGNYPQNAAARAGGNFSQNSTRAGPGGNYSQDVSTLGNYPYNSRSSLATASSSSSFNSKLPAGIPGLTLTGYEESKAYNNYQNAYPPKPASYPPNKAFPVQNQLYKY